MCGRTLYNYENHNTVCLWTEIRAQDVPNMRQMADHNYATFGTTISVPPLGRSSGAATSVSELRHYDV